jgi:hypothetical protein
MSSATLLLLLTRLIAFVLLEVVDLPVVMNVFPDEYGIFT